MRNKGFFWFLTILMTVICIYQLSFTFVSSGIESKVEKEAERKVAEMMENAKATGDSAILEYGGGVVHFDRPEGR